METDLPLGIFLASLLIISGIASLFLFLVPQSPDPAKRRSVDYFRYYFLFSCLAYCSFGLRDVFPFLVAVFFTHLLFLISTYCVLFGTLCRYQRMNQFHVRMGIVHIILYTLVQVALAFAYPDYILVRVVMIYVNMTAVLLYTLSQFTRFSRQEVYNERLLSICVGVFTLSIFCVPIAYYATNDLALFNGIMLLMQSTLVVLLFGAFFYTFSMDAIVQLEKNVSVDLMTGLYNRHFFIEQAGRFLKSARRHEFPVSVILCDIDNFRNINNEYGHQVGDKSIIHLAETLKSMTRQEDILARFGSEELIALLPQTKLESATLLANRLMNKINRVKVPDVDLNITASFGVTNIDQYVDIESSIRAVSLALIASREKGGNSISVDPNITA